MTAETSIMLDSALLYVAKGFWILPCCWPTTTGACGCGRNHKGRDIGKVPLTDNGFKDATQTRQGVKEFWTKWPDANIGCWSQKHIVIDEDNKENDNGKLSLIKLQEDYEILPVTLTNLSGSHLGHHYIFNNPTDIKIGNINLKTIYPGLDIRADNGYILLPPSLHKTGWRYEVQDDLPIVDAPTWLVTLLTSPVKKQLASTDNPITNDEIIPQGHQDDWLYRRACGYRTKGDGEETILAKLKIDLSRCPQDMSDPFTEKDLRDMAHRACNFEPELDIHNEHGKKQNSTIKTVTMSTVRAELVKFLWRPYIPLGKLTIIEGDPEAGKSWIALAIATAVSLGQGLPEMELTEPRRVLLASAEDGKSDTIRPRLDSMGANADFIDATDELFTLDDAGIERLENTVKVIKPLLVIIDPIMAYLDGNLDIGKANMVRHVTSRLAKLAETYDMAVIGVRHLTKNSSSKTIYRGQGSIDFTASARSVLLAGVDPDTQERGFVHIKCNIAAHGEAVGYKIEDNGGFGQFSWTGKSEITAARIFEIEIGDNALDKAKTFLRIGLADGEKLSTDIYQKANQQGIKERTLNTAKKQLAIISRREGEKGSKAGRWYWSLGGTVDDQIN